MSSFFLKKINFFPIKQVLNILDNYYYQNKVKKQIFESESDNLQD
jgi:hypothetical protein